MSHLHATNRLWRLRPLRGKTSRRWRRTQTNVGSADGCYVSLCTRWVTCDALGCYVACEGLRKLTVARNRGHCRASLCPPATLAAPSKWRLERSGHPTYSGSCPSQRQRTRLWYDATWRHTDLPHVATLPTGVVAGCRMPAGGGMQSPTMQAATSWCTRVSEGSR